MQSSHSRSWKTVVAACLCLLALAVAGPLFGQGVMRGLAYTSAGERVETGDLYVPTGTGPFPFVLYLHGGSWRSGSKGEWSRFATDLAAHGYASFSIDYDLRPHSFPTSWTEAREAVLYLRTHAEQYRLDPSAIAVAGSSAGGELASLLALAPEGPAGASDRTAVPVAAAVILNGVFDLQSDAHVITRYLGGRCEAVRAACADASPEQHVHAGAPPFFVGHGTGDHVVPYAEAEAFIDQLRSAGVPVTPYTASDGRHMYWEKKQFYAANLAAVEAFLAQTLRK